MWSFIREAIAFPAKLSNELINGRISEENNYQDPHNILTQNNETAKILQELPQEEISVWQQWLNENPYVALVVGVAMLSVGLIAWWKMRIPLANQENALEDKAEAVIKFEAQNETKKIPVQTLCLAFKERAGELNKNIIEGLNAYTPLANTIADRQKEILKHLGFPENGNVPEDKERFKQICNSLKVPCSF